MTRHSDQPESLRPDDQWYLLRDAARRDAEAVLRQVAKDQAEINARHAELGLIDPIVEVTGLSALDHAIASVRAMIEDLDCADQPVVQSVIARIPLPDHQTASASPLPLRNR